MSSETKYLTAEQVAALVNEGKIDYSHQSHLKYLISPGRCDHCRRLVLHRAEIDVSTSWHGGHIYRYCRSCVETTKNDRSKQNLLMAVAEVFYNSMYAGVGVYDIEGKVIGYLNRTESEKLHRLLQ